ncbi:hypothetical protein MCOR25_001440 [Pyricularia grisea]|uniref:Velvet domain-containing protein n=1 Tax=Pyricularia grisea TaxID=148305 RepID=A0A6P8AUC9_PYRGI|nr:uncharacterized protein PgNI_08706 [Pyricularia grisea]KAI6380914.1 hypothetical protein MCOR25_001440 [Pyricularia grisea]TLD05817.1 hypothetical protein PgNI_08706 [Pyricularia grisea]
MSLPSIGSVGSDRMAAYMHGQQVYTGQFGDPNLTPPQSETQMSAQASAQAVGQEPESDYKLVIRQEPQRARVAQGKEKDRKPIDPPPIVQLIRTTRSDPAQIYLQSPYYFMACTLIKGSDDDPDPNPNSMLGTLVSSLHKLRDLNNEDGGFFIFGDLSIKIEGVFRLQFTLFQMKDSTCVFLDSATSQPFTVYPQKNFEGMAESTFLTRSFSDQGVRLRVRKDSRAMTTRKRNHQHAEVAKKHSEWDRKQTSAVSRHSSINENDSTPTDARGPGSFAATGSSGYYDQHRSHYGETYGHDNYYGAGRSVKRARHEVSPGQYALPDLPQQTYATRQPTFSDSVASMTMPPVTTAAPSLAGINPMSSHHGYTGSAHPGFAPHRINTQVGGSHLAPQPHSAIASVTQGYQSPSTHHQPHPHTAHPVSGQAYPSPSPRQSPGTAPNYHYGSHHSQQTPVSLGLETYTSAGVVGMPGPGQLVGTSAPSPHLGQGYRHGMVNEPGA